MNACRVLAWAEIRRRWPALLALALLVGLGGATVASTAALARRTATVYDRLEATTSPADVQVMVNAGDAMAEQIAALPAVRAAWNAQVGVAAVGDDQSYLAVIGAEDRPPPGLLRPRAVEGRLPEPTSTDEIAVDQRIATEFDRGDLVGMRLPLHFLTLDDYRSFDTGFGRPHGPTVEVEVVGTYQIAGGADDVPPTVVSPGFVQAHPDALVAARQVFVRLNGAAAIGDYRHEVEAIGRAATLPAEAEEFTAVDITLPSAARGEVDATIGVLSTGLVIFGMVAGLVVLLLVTQALARYQGGAVTDQRIEHVLGLTHSQRVGARVLAAVPVAVVASVLTVAGVVIAAGMEPLGSLRSFEPNGGRSVNLAVAVIAALIVPAGVVVLTAATALRAARVADSASDPAQDAPWIGRTTGSPAAIGARFTLGRDRAAGPMRSAALGVAIGTIGVAAGLVFSTSLDRLIDTPARYGFDGDFALADTNAEVERELVEDPRIEGATAFDESLVRFDGRQVEVSAFRDLAEPAGWWVIEGALPGSPSEMMVGPRLARALDVGVGDEVVSDAGERMRVSGIGIGPSFGSAGFDSGALATPGGLDRLDGTQPFRTIVVRLAATADAGNVADHYGRSFELTEAAPPRAVRNLSELGGLPTALVTFLAAVGVFSLANAVFVAGRRRRRDLAVLRVLGHTPGANRVTVLTMTFVGTAVGLVVGLPIGVAVGRTLWRVVAEGASVQGDAVTPAVALAALLVGTLILAAATAAVPAWSAGRRSPGHVLRVE